ncbi:TetR/AcrR family transcriptional regulator [Hydrogenophaga borbori]|uniref:TetR/AcrR family transcriptional regulator n=1 Tax=Hydrogenophaga borbori TaxID=2294117 RepID=UPI00301D563C
MPTSSKRQDKPAPASGAQKPRARGVGRPPSGTREAIVAAAVEEFALEGFGGARIERISKRASTSDRMLYYHFDSKESLFQAALEKVYGDMIAAESRINLEQLDPREGLRRLIAFIWRYFQENPSFISLVNAENMYGARHMLKSTRIQQSAIPQLRMVEDLLTRGVAGGNFRRDVTVVELHLTIVSLCYYYLSNAATMSHFLGYDMKQSDARDAWLTHVTRVVMDFLMLR